MGRNRLTCVEYSTGKAADDSAVLIRLGNGLYFSLITAIFVDDDDDTFVRIWPVFVNAFTIDLSRIQEGTLADDENYYYIPVGDVIEKCVYWRIPMTRKPMFFRFSNFKECS